ncbi:hypothetical protein BDW68DRAFT_166879 [Aspergillus falconensis]
MARKKEGSPQRLKIIVMRDAAPMTSSVRFCLYHFTVMTIPACTLVSISESINSMLLTPLETCEHCCQDYRFGH